MNPQNNFEIDLKRESKKELETIDDDLRIKWISIHSLYILMCILFITMGLLKALLNRDHNFLNRSQSIWLWLGIFVLFCYFAAILIGLFKGPSFKAGTKPEETLDLFIRSIFFDTEYNPITAKSLKNAKLMQRDIQALEKGIKFYISFLGQSRHAYGNYDQFIGFWIEVRKKYLERCKLFFEDKLFENGEFSYELIRHDEKFREYLIKLAPTLETEKEDKILKTTATVLVAEVGERWYIASKTLEPVYEEIITPKISKI